MFRGSAFKTSILLILLLAIGGGPLFHDHEQAMLTPDPPIHHDGHTHDDDHGSVAGDHVPGAKIAYSGAGHTHLPSAFDNIHDTWMYQIGAMPRLPDYYTLHYVGLYVSLRQADDLLIEKPPQPSLMS